MLEKEREISKLALEKAELQSKFDIEKVVMQSTIEKVVMQSTIEKVVMQSKSDKVEMQSTIEKVVMQSKSDIEKVVMQSKSDIEKVEMQSTIEKNLLDAKCNSLEKELISTKGTLTSRGIFEYKLRCIHKEICPDKKIFNATDTCNRLVKISQSTTEGIMMVYFANLTKLQIY